LNMSRQREKMNRKVLTAAIALLMVLGTVFTAVPVHAIVNPLPNLRSGTPVDSGAAGSAETITAPSDTLATGLTPSHEVFVMFDKEVADADLGMPLFAFLASEQYVDIAPAMPTFTPGEPIYLHVAAGVLVNIGDTRLTPVTFGANTYAAGSVVAAGDSDVALGLTGILPVNVMHTGAATGYVVGNGIYIRDPTNVVAGPPAIARVFPGDLRALYPSVTVTLAGTGLTSTYAAWTKVYSPVLDYQKPIYLDIGVGNVGSVGAGDVRERNVVIPQVRYPAGSTVTAGEQDLLLAFATSAFLATDFFADTDGSGAWNSGETIYSVVGALTGLVKAGDIRNSYVGGYLPTTTVNPGDTDIGTAIYAFPATQSWYGPVGPAVYRYGDWIYNQAVGPLIATTVRASTVDWTDKGMAATGIVSTKLPAVWAVNWPNVVGYQVLVGVVQPGDSDVGRTLTAFAATDKHAGAGLYASGSLIYRDNDADNLISVGDTRQVIVANANARIYVGWPVAWAATAAPFYIPGTNVAAGDADVFGTAVQTFCTGVGAPVAACTGAERYYDQFHDGAYLGSDLVAVGGVSTTGYAAPFPVAAALTAAVPIPFTVPTNAPVGNHVVMITTDEPPFPTAMTAPFLNAGWKAFAGIAAGATQEFESLPWLIGPIVGAVQQDWDTNLFLTEAGPAFFAVISKVCAVQMSPGAYAHTLGTPASIVKLDYGKGAIIQNTTGDISLNITLCSEASSISIYIPPEFTFLQPDTRSVWTSITNDYKRVSMVKRSSADPIGPMWWNLRIVNSTIPIGGNVVRMFNVRAPDVCGRYFVKVFVDGESIGAENFPTIVVKGGLYPAYISGRVLNGDHGSYGVPVSVSGKVVADGRTALGEAVQAQAYFNASANGAYILYGLAAGTYNLTASAAGFVPTTTSGTATVHAGQSLEGIDIYVEPSATIAGTICSKCGPGPIPWGSAHSRTISMDILDSNLQSIAEFATNRTDYDPTQPYYPFSFNGSIQLDGHVPQDYAAYVSGLAVGDYYLEAGVNGYLQRDLVMVHVYDYSRTISVPFDLWRSSQFSVTVHFMDAQGFPGPTPWAGTLTLNAYPLDGTITGSNRSFVPAGSLTWTMEITGSFNHGLPSGTYFIEADFPGYSQPAVAESTLGEGCSTTSLSFDIIRGGILYLTIRSLDWQTPPLSVAWQYPNASIRIEVIGSLGQVYSGMGKQHADPFGGWTETVANVTGLPTDIYLVRAYTVGYVQAKDYHVSVSGVAISDMTVDLVEATRLTVTFTFRKEGLVAPIDTYARYNSTYVPVRVEVYDSFGILAGANVTHILAAGAFGSSIEVVGFRSYAGNPTVRWVNYYDTTDGSMQKDYGLPPGTYQVFVWVPGYVQAQPATFTTTLSAANVTLDLYFDRLAHVNGTVRGLDMYDNLIPLSWATITAYGPTLTETSSLDGLYEMWIVNGNYTLGVSSPGYAAQEVEIRVSMAWELPVDFDMNPRGGTLPELPAFALTLAFLVAMAHASCHMRFNLTRVTRKGEASAAAAILIQVICSHSSPYLDSALGRRCRTEQSPTFIEH